jgi:hypothetical protein
MKRLSQKCGAASFFYCPVQQVRFYFLYSFKMKWNVGCSGFSYKEWKNVFYPPGLPAREWFAHYSRHFTTLELNVTF